MKKPIYLIGLFALFLIASCTTKEQEVPSQKVIQIDPKQETNQFLPELTVHSMIPLESNDSSLIANIRTIEYFKDKFYIINFITITNGSLLAFSKDGKFINKTLSGKGPGENVDPFALFIDRKEGKIHLYDQRGGKINIYDSSLNYLEHKRVEGVPLSNFAILDNQDILISTHYYRDYVFKIYTPNLDSLKHQFVEDWDYNWGAGVERAISTLHRTLLISPYDYNVYELIGDTIKSVLYIDVGDNKITRTDVEENDISKVIDLRRSGERVSSPYNIAESNNFLSFSIYHDENKNYLYSFKSDNIYLLNEYFDIGMIPECKVSGVIEDDMFYALVMPEALMEFQQNYNQTEFDDIEVSDNQNPFILTFSISE